jgi:hypothetical protein
MNRIILIAVALGLSAPAIQSGQKATQATGTIIVYRQASFFGAGIPRFEFNVNHGPDLYVRMGRYQKLTLPAGDYVLDHNYSFALAAFLSLFADLQFLIKPR